MDEDLPAVGRIGLALHESGGFQAVHQLNRGVVPQGQAVSQLADRRMRAGGKALERQQGLVLLGLDSMGPGLHFTEVEELPELRPEFGELLILAES